MFKGCHPGISKRSRKSPTPAKRAPKFKHVWLEIYKINIYWVRCTWTQYVDAIKREFKTEPAKSAHCRARFEVYEKHEGRNRIPIGVIWLSKEANLAELSHECFHATHWVCHDRGIFLSDSSEEAYAYVLQFLISKIYKR